MINPNPLGDDVEWFGLAYHGLYVVERDHTAGYIRLKSGRRIYSAVPNREFDSTFTALVDNNMPAVTEPLDDPEAELWNVAIMSGAESEPYEVYPFEYRTRARYRRGGAGNIVSTSHQRVFVNLYGDESNFYITRLYHGSSPYQRQISPDMHKIPSDKLSSTTTTSSRLLDITPDGKRCLVMVSIYSDLQPAFIAEIEYSSDFVNYNVSVVADYTDINDSSGGTVYGDEINSMALVIRVVPGTGPGTAQHMEYYDGIGNDYSLPDYNIYQYGVGSSSASSSGETIIGAWYNSNGQVEFVRARWETSSEITVSTPVRQPAPNSSYWVSPVTTNWTTSLTIISGGSSAVTTTVTTNTALDEYTASQVVTSSTGDSISSVFDSKFSGMALRPHVTRASASSDYGVGAVAHIASNVGSIRLSPTRLSNKIYTSLVRVSRDVDEYIENIVGSCVTPSGVDSGVKRSGNIYAASDPRAPWYDSELALRSALFMRGAYNPVTGEVERNRTDGATYTWV